MNNIIDLLIVFIQIGAVSFGGGYAALPIIQDIIVNNRGWLSNVEMTDIVTISQLTPGPIAINAASFVGTKMAGLTGAIVATIGNIIPQTIFMLFLGKIFLSGKKLNFLDNILKGLRPGVVGLIASATISLLMTALFPNGINKDVDFLSMFTLILGLALYCKKISIFKLIGLGALIGILTEVF